MDNLLDIGAPIHPVPDELIKAYDKIHDLELDFGRLQDVTNEKSIKLLTQCYRDYETKTNEDKQKAFHSICEWFFAKFIYLGEFQINADSLHEFRDIYLGNIPAIPLLYKESIDMAESLYRSGLMSKKARNEFRQMSQGG